MQPTPSSPTVSSSSGSIQRLSIEYDGWWISRRTPMPASNACASRVLAGEYDEMPT